MTVTSWARPPVPLAAFLVAFACCAGAASARAATFETLSQARSASIYGRVAAVHLESGTTRHDEDRQSAATPEADVGPARLNAGLALELPDGWAYAQGRAEQFSSLGPDSIRFSGLADANVSSGSADVQAEGSAGASVDFTQRFELDAAQDVRLTMNSAVLRDRSEDFQFLLAADDGRVIWADTLVVGDDGVVRRSFSQLLKLQAGRYTLSASLRAGAFLSGDLAQAGRTQAEFTLAPVPEPGTWALAGLGLVALVWRMRPARRNDDRL